MIGLCPAQGTQLIVISFGHLLSKVALSWAGLLSKAISAHNFMWWLHFIDMNLVWFGIGSMKTAKIWLRALISFGIWWFENLWIIFLKNQYFHLDKKGLFPKIYLNFVGLYQIQLKSYEQNKFSNWNYGQKSTTSHFCSFKLHN